MDRCLGRVCHHSEAMQWVQGVCRLGSRQWKSQEGSLTFKWLQFTMFWTVLRFEKVFVYLEIGEMGMHCG